MTWVLPFNHVFQKHLPQWVERARRPIHGTFQNCFFFFPKQVQVIPKRKVGAVLDLEEFTVLIEKEVCTGETLNNIKHP